MVCTCTSDFSLDVPESLDACARAAATGPLGATPTGPHGTTLASLPPLPPPPPPPMSIKQLLVTHNELMQVLTENLVHRGVLQPHHHPVVIEPPQT
jgi:hypothetical protein